MSNMNIKDSNHYTIKELNKRNKKIENMIRKIKYSPYIPGDDFDRDRTIEQIAWDYGFDLTAALTLAKDYGVLKNERKLKKLPSHILDWVEVDPKIRTAYVTTLHFERTIPNFKVSDGQLKRAKRRRIGDSL